MPIKTTKLPRLLVLLLCAFSAQSVSAGTLFCCLDEHNKQVCGDPFPSSCYARGYREIGASGRTKRLVNPPLTAEQRTQRELAQKRQAEEETLIKEQQRKDQALLETYANEEEIETLRKRAEQEIKQSIQQIEEKLVTKRQERQTLENEAEFYKKRALPEKLEKSFNNLNGEVKLLLSVIDAKRKELEQIRIKYSEDQRRYIQLVRQRAAASGSGTGSTSPAR
ncbi:MAG: hypothetical protein V4623_00795 [Pseudomonadota bacterium]